MKKIKKIALMCLVINIFLVMQLFCGSVFALNITNEEPDIIEISTTEIMPMMAYDPNQYSNRYFDTLSDAKEYYGQNWTYVQVNSFNKDPGCYGGYWCDGGTYSYYYTLTCGQRVYLQIG